MCPHLWNETGSETRWSGNVYISKNETGNETRWSGSVPISLTKLGVRPGDQKVFQSLERNWEWDQVPCLLMDRDKMSNLYREPSIDASYQVSVRMVEGFQRRRLKCEKLTDDRRRTPSDGKSSHCLWQDELKIKSKSILSSLVPIITLMQYSINNSLFYLNIINKCTQ